MSNWSPELESDIRTYGELFDGWLSDIFNAANLEEALAAGMRENEEMDEVRREIEEKMGVGHAPTFEFYIPQMIALASQNRSDAGDKLKKVWSKLDEMKDHLRKDPGNGSIAHSIALTRRVGMTY